MSSIEGNFNRASRKYLTKIGYLTESRPQLFLNGEQLRGIAGQQRSNRKFEGFNEAADREYDAAVLDYKKSQVDFYMPTLPKSKKKAVLIDRWSSTIGSLNINCILPSIFTSPPIGSSL